MASTPRLSHGERKRREILEVAVDVSSAEGLDGLSIGHLADEIGMSKSGLFAHFGSKEELQLATIELASGGFEGEVLSATQDAEPGLARLRALIEAWIAYVDGIPFRGGCFFAATSTEFGSRPGLVRDLLAARTQLWIRTLEREARTAARLGELRREVDPAQLAFELHAFVQEANWVRELLGDARAFDRARAAVETTLRRSIRAGAARGTKR